MISEHRQYGFTCSDVVPMYNVFGTVKVKPFWICDIWGIGDWEIRPFASLDSRNSKSCQDL